MSLGYIATLRLVKNRDEGTRFLIKRLCNVSDCRDARAVMAVLDAVNSFTVNTDALSKLSLRKTAFLPKFTNCFSQFGFEG